LKMNREELIQHYRGFLKDSLRKDIDFSQTDQNLEIDGKDEFTIYLASVGKR
jgi:hypothetical protein